MEMNIILEFNNKESVSDVLSELLRDGAQHLIHQAVELELNEYFSQHQRLTADGRIALVRNGYLPKREILTGIGPVSVRIPKVRSRDGEPLTFRSALVPVRRLFDSTMEHDVLASLSCFRLELSKVVLPDQD